MTDTLRASLTDSGGEVFDYLYDQRISTNGRYVAFLDASNALEPGTPDDIGESNVAYWFIKDMDSGQLSRVRAETFFPQNSFEFRPNAFQTNYDVTLSDTTGIITYNGYAARFDLATGNILNEVEVPDSTNSSTVVNASGSGRFAYSVNQSFDLTNGGVNERFGEMNIIDAQTSSARTIDFGLKTYAPKTDSNTTLSVTEEVFFSDASADGRYVLVNVSGILFKSAPNDLRGGSIGLDYGIYDTQSGSFNRLTKTISDAAASATASTPFMKERFGVDTSSDITDDGKTVVFSSDASNLVLGDTNNTSDVFAIDTATHAITRISVSDTGAQMKGESSFAAISGNGRYALFTNTFNYAADLYVRDMQTGKVKLVNATLDGSDGDVAARRASISADGKFIAFTSNSAAYVAGDNNKYTDAFRTLNPLFGPGNTAPTALKLSAASIMEGAKAGTAIGTLLVTDADAGDTFTFKLTDDAGGRFALSGDKLIVKNGALLDYEKAKSDTVTVEVADKAGATLTKVLGLVITNTNEAPQITSGKGAAKVAYSLAENTQTIADLKATDADGNKLTWSLSGSDAALFAVNAKTGALAFKAAPDFETPKDSGKNNAYDLVVKVSDGKLADSQALSIKVTDVKGKALKGDGKDNTLKGTLEAETLTGSKGADKLWGGDGSDHFVFKALSDSTASAKGQDTIYDFARGDRFDLSAIDANGKGEGNSAFAFIGTEKFSGHAGELRFEKLKSDTYVYGDTNGDKKVDFAFHLDDAVKLVKVDFLL